MVSITEPVERDSPALLAWTSALSAVGARLEAPTGSILVQAERNRGTRYDASMGVTTQNQRSVHLPVISEKFNFDGSDTVRYAPSDGFEELRRAYKQRITKQNQLAAERFGLPVITNGVTHALSIFSQLFCDPGDTLIVHDQYWENYDLIFGAIGGVNILTYPLFDMDGEFNLAGFETALRSVPGRAAVLINFPNNPTGFSPDHATYLSITHILNTVADECARPIPVIIDEAGYGFFFEDDVCRESLFSFLIKDSSLAVLPVLAKGSTKEDLAYALRIGCITFGAPAEIAEKLEGKVAALIRGQVSTINTPGQLAISAALLNEQRRDKEFQSVFDLVNERYRLLRYDILPDVSARGFDEYFSVFPFNSGFFITMETVFDAYELQDHLRTNDVGVTVLDSHSIRIGFASVDLADLQPLFDILLETARSITQANQ